MTMHKFGMYFKQLSLPTVPPSRPSLTGSPINALSVQLMWERPLGEVDSYTIQYSVVNSSELTDTDFEASASHWIVRGLSPNTSYQFRLVAGNRYGRSLPSLPFFATTPVQSGKCIRILRPVCPT